MLFSITLYFVIVIGLVLLTARVIKRSDDDDS